MVKAGFTAADIGSTEAYLACWHDVLSGKVNLAVEGDNPSPGLFLNAPVPREAEVVRLSLADGSRPTVEVRTSETTGIAWFAYEADSPVAGPAEVLDGDGDPVRPPG